MLAKFLDQSLEVNRMELVEAEGTVEKTHDDVAGRVAISPKDIRRIEELTRQLCTQMASLK